MVDRWQLDSFKTKRSFRYLLAKTTWWIKCDYNLLETTKGYGVFTPSFLLLSVKQKFCQRQFKSLVMMDKQIFLVHWYPYKTLVWLLSSAVVVIDQLQIFFSTPSTLSSVIPSTSQAKFFSRIGHQWRKYDPWFCFWYRLVVEWI